MKKTKVLQFAAAVLLSLTLALSNFSFFRFDLAFFANAAYDEDAYIPVLNELISDGMFENASSSYPSSPSGWTGSPIGSSSDSNSVKGIIDLSPSSFLSNYKERYRLAKKNEDDITGFDYFDPEGKITDENGVSIPERRLPSPKERDFTKVLMINNTNPSAYQYKSETLSILPNHYYEISAQVMTSNFNEIPNVPSANRGAFLRLSGDLSATTEPINTNYSWQKYRFLISGHSFKTQSINLNLMLGDNSTPTDDEPYNAFLPTKGFAFFFNIIAIELTYDQYMAYTESDSIINDTKHNQIVHTTSKEVSYSDGGIENGGFEQPLSVGWSNAEKGNNANTSVVNLTDFASLHQTNTKYLKTNPHAVMGSVNALMIASKPSLAAVYGSVTSNDITILRHNYYRLSFWVNDTDIITSGTTSGTAYAKIVSDEENEEITFENSSFTLIDENSWHRKWKIGAFYIQGSMFYDRKVQLELGAGTSDNPFSGVVYFDNIKLEQITSQEYQDNSSSGITVNFESVSGTPTVTNGFFNVSGSFDEYKYPVPAQDWTQNVSTDFEDNVVSGIVPTDYDHFEKYREEFYGNVANPAGPLSNTANNVLMMWNKTDAAQKYTSSSISLTADTYHLLTVKLATSEIDSSKGARLVLNDANCVMARLSDINTNGKFLEYSFKVKTNAFAQTVTLDIILGEEGNLNKDLVSGYLWIDEVILSTTTAEAFDIATVRTGKFSYGDEKFQHNQPKGSSELLTSDTMSLIVGNNTTNMNTVVTGVVDMDSEASNSIIPNFEQLKKGRNSRYGLLLHSLTDTAFGYQMKLPIQYNSSTYVKVNVRLKTMGFQPGTGARIMLDSTYAFNNVNSRFPTIVTPEMMTDYVAADFYYRGDSNYSFQANEDLEFEGLDVMHYNGDYIYNPQMDMPGFYDGWLDYTFYINTGTTRTSDTISIWLGNDNLFKNHMKGTVLIDEITSVTITEDEYNEISTIMSAEDTLKPNYIMRVTADVTETPEVDTGEDSDASETDISEDLTEVDTRWWMLPSLTFGIVLIFAVVMVGFRKLAPKVAGSMPRRKRVASYDRERPIMKADKAKAERIKKALSEIEEEEGLSKKAGYSSFDEEDADYDDYDEYEDEDLEDDDDDKLEEQDTEDVDVEDADTEDAGAEESTDEEVLDADSETEPTVLSDDDEPIAKKEPKPKPKKEKTSKKPAAPINPSTFDSFDD